jgi:hypothetical protein
MSEKQTISEEPHTDKDKLQKPNLIQEEESPNLQKFIFKLTCISIYNSYLNNHLCISSL